MKKDAIIAYFKQKYPALNLRKSRLDVIAARLEDKVQDESELDTKLDALNEILPFADIAKEDDARHEAERKVKEAAQKKADTQPTTEKKEEEVEKPKDEMPAWFKTYAEANDKKIDALIGDKVATTRRSSYETNALKGVDDKTKNRELANFDRLTKDMTDEEYTVWETEQTAFHQENVQQQQEKDLGGLPPIIGSGASGKPSDKELDAIVDGLKI